ncbi:MAG: hypothetical protein JWQ25_280 [Daejeonella sp.]|nr:hypothetical protein [Daejeonella sp.]
MRACPKGRAFRCNLFVLVILRKTQGDKDKKDLHYNPSRKK